VGAAPAPVATVRRAKPKVKVPPRDRQGAALGKVRIIGTHTDTLNMSNPQAVKLLERIARHLAGAPADA
jgi:hypothetical protein